MFPLLTVLGLIHVSAAQQVTPLSYPPSYQGTVQAVRRQVSEVDLLTGVGEALRVLHLRVVPATQITSGAGSATVADILPGDLIRAECHQTPGGLVADRIEKLGRLDSSGGPGAGRP